VKVFKWGGGVGADVEGSLGSGGFDVPDVDVVEAGEALLGWRDGCREGDVVRGWVFEVGRERGVAVGGVPVHGDVDGDSYAFEGEVVDADVVGEASAGAGGFEEDSGGDAGEGGEIVGFDVAEAAGGLGTDGYGGGSVANDAVAEDYVFGGAVDAQPIGVAAGFEAEGVVVDVDVGVLDEDVAGGVDVDAVGGWAFAAFVVADGDAVESDVVGVEDLDGPEAGALGGCWRSSGRG
jgi:hypothetical protein